MKTCRDCQQTVSEQATACPHCGAPFPAKEKWDGWGLEYRSRASILGWPLVHISFKYRPNRMPVPARGIIAIGQFAVGIVNISQFGIGIFSLSQFAISIFAVAQIGIAYRLVAQFGVFVEHGYGQFVCRLADLLDRL